MNITIDLETIPDQSPNALEKIMDTIKVKAPDLTKPKLIDALGLCQKNDKFKTVAELKEFWIELHGEQAKREQANEQWLKTSFDGTKGQICCIGLAHEDGEPVSFVGAEVDILNQFNEWVYNIKAVRSVESAIPPNFIGHNLIKFDLPFLHKRMVINGVKPKFKLIPHARHGLTAFDTMVEWCGFGNRISMDNLAEALGLKGKTEGMDGSQVWPEYQKGNIDKIANYCIDDVICTRNIYNKLTFK
jgi:DNA polymerase elongation subunit (family B)